MRVKKVDVLPVAVEVKYNRPILGRLFAFLVWIRLVRFKKFNLVMNGKTICTFYRLIVPRFMKGGGSGEE